MLTSFGTGWKILLNMAKYHERFDVTGMMLSRVNYGPVAPVQVDFMS